MRIRTIHPRVDTAAGPLRLSEAPDGWFVGEVADDVGADLCAAFPAAFVADFGTERVGKAEPPKTRRQRIARSASSPGSETAESDGSPAPQAAQHRGADVEF